VGEGAAEIVHSSERTRVTRLFLSGRTLIRKEPLGADAERRLQQEAAILQRLRGVSGVAQLVDSRYMGSILLADAGGTSLAGLSKPLSVEDLIALALKLTRAVARMHGRGVIHRDISPANIVVADNATPCLVDFGLAISAAEIRPEFSLHRNRRNHRVYGARADWPYRPVGGPACRPVRAGCHAV
jgi:serine/threonine protein kinase